MSSKIGHILSQTWGNQIAHHFIIGQYKSRYSSHTTYVLSQWNAIANRFLEKSEASYFFEADKATISKAAFPMSESAKAMARAYRLMKIATRVMRWIRSVGVGIVAIEPAIFHRGAWDVSSRAGFVDSQQEAEYLFGDETRKKELIAFWLKLQAMIKVEMETADFATQNVSATLAADKEHGAWLDSLEAAAV
jgi:hypothetical protein